MNAFQIYSSEWEREGQKDGRGVDVNGHTFQHFVDEIDGKLDESSNLSGTDFRRLTRTGFPTAS